MISHLLKDPQENKNGLKVLSYGSASTFKTLFALTFPKSLAIDAEKGMAFYQGKDVGKNIVKVADTRSFYDLIDLLEYALDNHKELGIETVVIDSITKFKKNMEEVIITIDERRAREDGKDENEAALSMRSYGRIAHINDKIANLILDLSSKGINVVMIAQAKDVKEMRSGTYTVVGVEPNAQKKIDHEFDLTLYHFAKEVKGSTEYWARVEKDRTYTFKKGSEIQNPNYKLWSDAVETDAEVSETDFSRQTEESKERYTEEAIREELSMQEKIVELVKSLDAEEKKAFQAELAAAKINKFEGLTVNAQKKLKAIYEKYAK